MMASLYYQLEQLFTSWESRSRENGEVKNNTVRDGLLYKSVEDSSTTEQKWTSSRKRIAFLLKDNNQDDGNGDWYEDVREWLIDTPYDCTASDAKVRLQRKSNNRALKTPFLRKIGHLFYGLYKSEPTPELQWWYQGEIDQHYADGRIAQFFNAAPVALIECKKQPGGSKLNDSILRYYLQAYGDLLMQELDILNPNIIVCMGGPIFDFMIKAYSNFEMVEYGVNCKNGQKNVQVYYVKGLKKVIIYAEHPSGRGGFENHYEGVMCWYREFLNSSDYLDCFRQ